jgi:hypothetical protein
MNCVRSTYTTPYAQPEHSLELTRLRLDPYRATKRAAVRVRRNRRKKLTLIRRAERMLFSVAAVGLVWFGASTAIQSIQVATRPPQTSTAKLSVGPGATLWQIAGRLSGSDGRQIEVMNEIRALNPSLSGRSNLSVGQTLVVPVVQDGGQSGVHLARASENSPSAM